MHPPRIFAVLISLLLLAGWGYSSTLAQVQNPPLDEQKYFPQSGHYVGGDFLKKYTGVTNPEKVFGYPITKAYYDVKFERLIQYFEKALFVHHPERSGDERVEVAHIGTGLYQPQDELRVYSKLANCVSFTEYGVKEVVCSAFRDFFEANGGVAQFGFPESNFEIHDNYVVQYFQKARFEWHPNNPPGERVILTDLGRQYFEMMGENPIRLTPEDAINNSNRAQLVLDLIVRATPTKAILPLRSSQTIHISVQDQNLQPVPDAEITVEISLPSGQTLTTQDIAPTDGNGLTQLTFDYQETTPGLVKLLIYAKALGYEKATTTSFQIWW